MGDQATRFTLRHATAVAGGGLMMALNVLAFVSVGFLLPPLAKSLDVGLGVSMLFVSITMLSAAATLTVAGSFLLRRLGSRWLILVGGVFTGLAWFAIGSVSNLLQLYLLAFASGAMLFVATQIPASALVNDWFIKRRGTMQGMTMAIASLGGITAGLVLPLVIRAGGWPSGFRFVGGIFFVVSIVVSVVLVRPRPADLGLLPYGAHDHIEEEVVEHTGVAASRAIRSGAFVALGVSLAIIGVLMSVQQHFAALMEARGLDLVATGTLLSILSLSTVATTLILGGLSDRWGPLVAYTVMGVQLFGSFLMILLTTGFGPQLVAILLMSMPAITPPIMTPVLLRAGFGGRSFTALLGVLTGAFPAGVAIGAPLWGVVRDVTGSYQLGLVGALFLAVACVLLVWYSVLAGRRMWTPVEAPATTAMVTACD